MYNEATSKHGSKAGKGCDGKLYPQWLTIHSSHRNVSCDQLVDLGQNLRNTCRRRLASGMIEGVVVVGQAGLGVFIL